MVTLFWWLGLIFAIILGLGWGSYATMATYRFPRGESWSGKKPRCPSCGHELKFKDFAPIYAYVVSRGKCKFCGVPVTPVYLCTEIYTTLLFILSYLVFGFSELFLLVSTFGVFVAILTTTELESNVIPEKLLLLMLMVAIPYRVLVDGSIYGLFWGGLMGMAAGYAYYAAKAKYLNQPFDLHQEFLKIYAPGYVYLRILVIMGICLPPLAFLVVLLLSGVLIGGLRVVWKYFSIPLPRPYGAVFSALTFLALLLWHN